MDRAPVLGVVVFTDAAFSSRVQLWLSSDGGLAAYFFFYFFYLWWVVFIGICFKLVFHFLYTGVIVGKQAPLSVIPRM